MVALLYFNIMRTGHPSEIRQQTPENENFATLKSQGFRYMIPDLFIALEL